MVPVEPNLEGSIGHDALKVWLDFWELTGRLRVNIVRRTPSGGDPAKMISPDLSVTTIHAVPAILVGRDADSLTDRAGEIPTEQIKLEFIDCVHETDRIEMGGVEYEVDSVLERDLGGFAIWVVQMHRIE